MLEEVHTNRTKKPKISLTERQVNAILKTARLRKEGDLVLGSSVQGECERLRRHEREGTPSIIDETEGLSFGEWIVFPWNL